MTYRGKEKEDFKGEYYGYWENGKRHGEGVFTYPTEDTYSGWWKYGKREGKGTYTFAKSGIKLVGQWGAGNFVQGRWVLPNGTYYEGEFLKNQPNGRGIIAARIRVGKWVFPNENVAEGDYAQAEEERETPEGDKKMEVKLTWKTAADIVKAGEKVNSCEALSY